MIEKELLQQQLLSEVQFQAITKQREAADRSLLTELRLLLYLGVLMLTAGVGYFTYLNIGSMGHLILQGLMLVGILICAYFIQAKKEAFSPLKSSSSHPYLDHILLLEALLIGTFLVYVLIHYEWATAADAWSSFLCATLFIFMAYRYDHRGLLSIGITALIAGFGLSVSPVDWVQGNWVGEDLLPLSGIILGLTLFLIDWRLKKANIKVHFSFLIQLYAYLLFYVGAFGLYMDNSYWKLDHWAFALTSCLIASALAFYTWKQKQFLFFLFSALVAYVNFIVFLALAMAGDSIIILVYFIPISCIGFARLLLKNKSHFKS